MLLSVYAGILIIIFASLTTAMLNGHHKVRHKHHLLNVVHDNHVNEIRSAFDQYRKALHKSRKYNLREIPTANVATLSDEYTDEIENSLNSINHFAATLDRTSSVNQQIISENSPDKYFLRSKRLHVPTRSTISTKKSTTSTLKSIDNYDDEYDDDDNDTTNRRLSDAQVGLMPLKRDSPTQLAEGESLTEFKMKTLGTRENVRNSFQQHLNNTKDVHFHINQNLRRLREEGLCRWPSKKLIEMPQFASKMYTPRKYVIYQCSDDTACCGSYDKTCVAKKSEEVVLWFHVRFVNTYGVEPLKIQNHTECECVYKNRASSQNRLQYPWPFPTPATTTKAPLCKCPSHFEAETDLEEGICGCVCKEGNADCLQRHEGREGFTMSDQRCIMNNVCVHPKCSFGMYSINKGRCPERNDKINEGFEEVKTVTDS